MTTDLFAVIPVRDYAAAVTWYERLLGAESSFLPDDSEAAWELAEHRHVYIHVRPEHAWARDAHRIRRRLRRPDLPDCRAGLEPAERETYANGVRKATFRDPDGNEIGFGGAPV